MDTESLKHTYLVGYIHDKGFGRAFLHLVRPLTNEDAIVRAEALLAEKNGFSCSIFTFQSVEIRD